MGSNESKSVRIAPIAAADVDAVAHFLHENLNPRVSANDWSRGIAPPWSVDGPNHGMMLLDGERIVGAFPAIYCVREVRGEKLPICNPHSWFVLENHRAKSMRLVLALVKQPGYQFVMWTPNPSVAEIFRFLKFRPVSPDLVLLPCIPWPFSVFGGVTAASRTQELAQYLNGDMAKVWQDHRELPWLCHLAVGDAQGRCHIVFKRQRIKRVPIARVLHVSDPDQFFRLWRPIGNALLARFALFGVMTEARWLRDVPRPAIHRVNGQPKLIFGDRIDERSIDDLYSELVALDI